MTTTKRKPLDARTLRDGRLDAARLAHACADSYATRWAEGDYSEPEPAHKMEALREFAKTLRKTVAADARRAKRDDARRITRAAKGGKR